MIYTSNFASLKKLAESKVEPICIAVGKPRWFKGKSYLNLAPTRPMLKMDPDQYNVLFEQILADQDPADVKRDLENIGEHVAILCWEGRGVRCHRRRVAEWLEEKLGIVVTEFGQERHEVLKYLDMPSKLEANRSKKKPPQKPSNPQLFLF